MEGDKVTKDISRKPTGVLYLDRSRAFFYEQRLGAPLAFDLPAEIISDLEVINKKKLDSAIRGFVGANNLVPNNIIVLLSNSITFEKEFPQGGVGVDKSIEEFLEFVPFEEYVSKKIQISGKTKIVAANRELCEDIKTSFRDIGFVVTGVFPLSFCIDVLPQLATNLDLGLVIEKAPELRQFNLLPEEQQPTSSLKKEKPDRKRMYMLIGAFGFLGFILLFFVYRNIIAAPKTSKSLPTVVAPPSPTASVKFATTSAQIQPNVSFSSPSANVQDKGQSQ
ncbi:MAG: hypothetical protein HY426_01585 [Candidatus Levybacteria bacterium]|nr:hypothetical protein [Candidatus Levybacteria bacterium]